MRLLSRPYLLAVAALSFLVAAVGWVPLHAPPLLDDVDEFFHVAGLHSLRALFGVDCFGFWRPFKNLLFAFAHQTSLPAAHVAALSIYAAAVFCLHRWGRGIGLGRWQALLLSAVWALSPTLMSSVAWLSSVNIMAMTALSLIALHCWRDGTTIAMRAAGIAAFAAALLCYEGAIAVPALWLLSIIYWQKTRARGLRLVLQAAPWALTLGVYLLMRRSIGGISQAVNDHLQPDIPAAKLSAASALFTCEHLLQWLWPFGNQHYLAGFIWPADFLGLLRIGTAWLCVGGLLAIVVLLRRRLPLVSFGLAWFLAAFAPLSNLLPFRSGPYGDYYIVLPSVGLSLAAVGVLHRLLLFFNDAEVRPLWVRPAILALIAWRGAAGAGAFLWADAWTNEQHLLERSLAARPDGFKSQACLARIYLAQNRLDDAARLARQSANIAPWTSQGLFVRGQIALAQRQIGEAKTLFTEAAARYPKDPYPLTALGYIADEHEHDAQSAKTFYRAALKLRWSENSATAVLNLSAILATEGDAQEARQVMESALPRMAQDPQLLHNLAVACKQTGDLAAAEKYLARYNALRPRARQ